MNETILSDSVDTLQSLQQAVTDSIGVVGQQAAEAVASSGYVMPVWGIIPFALMLLTIAIGPLLVENWWDKNRNKLIVALFLGVPTAVFLIIKGLAAELEEQLIYDYIPFIILLLSLYVVTGGIRLTGDIKAKPSVNTLFLGIGYVLASFIGTTGAAMLLIRPILATNAQREHKVHTVLFFIATVANCGGLLTPLGDPPLFIFYLRGAEFTWFFNLFPEWAFVGAILLFTYYLVDKYYYKKEHWTALSADAREVQPLSISGRINLIYLLGIILSVAFINVQYIPDMKEADAPIWIKFLREIVLLSIVFLSVYHHRKKVRQDNNYSWGPIIEVAIVFLGIFTTMTPALIYLKANAAHLNLIEPWQFYYYTGALSSFLDNTPTAVAFYSVATGLPEASAAMAQGVVKGTVMCNGVATSFVAGIPEILLKAISLGAVVFGAMTYIGNGPNFMVKAIAEKENIKMPSFFGYMIKFSLIVLLPIYILVQLIFL